MLLAGGLQDACTATGHLLLRPRRPPGRHAAHLSVLRTSQRGRSGGASAHPGHPPRGSRKAERDLPRTAATAAPSREGGEGDGGGRGGDAVPAGAFHSPLPQPRSAAAAWPGEPQSTRAAPLLTPGPRRLFEALAATSSPAPLLERKWFPPSQLGKGQRGSRCLRRGEGRSSWDRRGGGVSPARVFPPKPAPNKREGPGLSDMLPREDAGGGAQEAARPSSLRCDWLPFNCCYC